jgi:hypothetical protein
MRFFLLQLHDHIFFRFLADLWDVPFSCVSFFRLPAAGMERGNEEEERIDFDGAVS